MNEVLQAKREQARNSKKFQMTRRKLTDQHKKLENTYKKTNNSQNEKLEEMKLKSSMLQNSVIYGIRF